MLHVAIPILGLIVFEHTLNCFSTIIVPVSGACFPKVEPRRTDIRIDGFFPDGAIARDGAVATRASTPRKESREDVFGTGASQARAGTEAEATLPGPPFARKGVRA